MGLVGLGFDFFPETLVKPRGHIENVYRKAVLHLCHPDRVSVTAPDLQTSVALAVFYCRCCLTFKAGSCLIGGVLSLRFERVY